MRIQLGGDVVGFLQVLPDHRELEFMPAEGGVPFPQLIEQEIVF